MSKPEKKSARSDLIDAAEALDADLRQYEGLVDAARKAPLSSQKALERAASLLKDVADGEDRLGASVRSLVEAINAARERQEKQAQAAHARALELANRTNLWKELMVGYGTLAQAAADLNGMMQVFAAQKDAAGAPSTNGASGAEGEGSSRDARLSELLDALSRVASGAHDLAQAAEGHDFQDMAREADSIRQKLLSARNRLELLRKASAKA